MKKLLLPALLLSFLVYAQSEKIQELVQDKAPTEIVDSANTDNNKESKDEDLNSPTENENLEKQDDEKQNINGTWVLKSIVQYKNMLKEDVCDVYDATAGLVGFKIELSQLTGLIDKNISGNISDDNEVFLNTNNIDSNYCATGFSEIEEQCNSQVEKNDNCREIYEDYFTFDAKEFMGLSLNKNKSLDSSIIEIKKIQDSILCNSEELLETSRPSLEDQPALLFQKTNEEFSSQDLINYIENECKDFDFSDEELDEEPTEEPPLNVEELTADQEKRKSLINVFDNLFSIDDQKYLIDIDFMNLNPPNCTDTNK